MGPIAGGLESSTKSEFILLANVKATHESPGTARGSNGLGAKALGLLFCQQALCLSGRTSDPCSSKQPTGSRWVGCLVRYVYESHPYCVTDGKRQKSDESYYKGNCDPK